MRRLNSSYTGTNGGGDAVVDIPVLLHIFLAPDEAVWLKSGTANARAAHAPLTFKRASTGPAKSPRLVFGMWVWEH